MPRIIFEKFHPSQFAKMLKQETLLKQIASIMADLTTKHGLDGLVVEVWNSIREGFQTFLYTDWLDCNH